MTLLCLSIIIASVIDDTDKNGTSSNGDGHSTNLGQRLRALSDKVLESGVERLSADQIQEMVATIRAKSV